MDELSATSIHERELVIGQEVRCSRHPPISKSICRPENVVRAGLVPVPVDAGAGNVCLLGDLVNHLSKFHRTTLLNFHRFDT